MAYKGILVGRLETTHNRKHRKVLVYKKKSVYYLYFFINGVRQNEELIATNKSMAMHEAFIFITGMFTK